VIFERQPGGGIVPNIDEIVRQADERFWAEVVRLVPEAKSGDFPFDLAAELDRVHRQAIEAWIELNVPKRPESIELTVSFYEIDELEFALRQHADWCEAQGNRATPMSEQRAAFRSARDRTLQLIMRLNAAVEDAY
jgi:hypothetical protein